ncbi:MAG: type II secretion system F family protein, partial [Sphingomonadales bacterium]
MEQYLPTGIEIVDIITVMAGLATFLIVLAIWNATLAHDPMRGRLKALNARRQVLKSGYTAARRRAPINRARSMGAMKQVLNRFNLMKDEQNRKFSQKLNEAGIRSKDAVVVFMFFKLILPVIIGICAFVALFGLQITDWQGTHKLVAAVGAMLAASL